MGIDVVVLTRGADGLAILTTDGEQEASAPLVNVADTVGAGDTIVATVLTSLVENGVSDRAGLGQVSAADWQEYARRAVVSAAITCSRPGADAPHRQELDW